MYLIINYTAAGSDYEKWISEARNIKLMLKPPLTNWCNQPFVAISANSRACFRIQWLQYRSYSGAKRTSVLLDIFLLYLQRFWCLRRIGFKLDDRRTLDCVRKHYCGLFWGRSSVFWLKSCLCISGCARKLTCRCCICSSKTVLVHVLCVSKEHDMSFVEGSTPNVITRTFSVMTSNSFKGLVGC